MNTSTPEHSPDVEGRDLGWFRGVFRPTFLTVLGAMLYLRLGWLVGENGLPGSIMILLVCVTITGTTALSVASIATNQRVAPGGAFGIISQAVGLEAGGAIGWPLYVAQALSASMYAYAFAEVFTTTFTAGVGLDLPLVPVALVAFVAVVGLAWRSADLVAKAQGILLFVVLAAVISLFGGWFSATEWHMPTLVARGGSVGVVTSFAVFFPAVTGIMVGVGMSGQLSDPSESIPRGTLTAWAATSVLYLVGAVWYAMVVPADLLLSSNEVAFDYAFSGVVVRIGLLFSTLVAALSSLVASSALLHALAANQLAPRWEWLSEPTGRRATLVSAAVASVGLLSGSLDAIAPIITAFFILTYLSLNAVVLLEQQLAMISFRPTYPVTRWVPALGVVMSGSALVFASPRSLLILGVLAVMGLFIGFSKAEIETPWETARSGLNVALAAWAARRAAAVGRQLRSWKPDLLAPIVSPEQTGTVGPLLEAVAGHHGSAKVMAVGEDVAVRDAALGIVDRLRKREVFATYTALSEDGFSTAFSTALDAMQGDLFPPNLVVLDLTRIDERVLKAADARCRALKLGLMVYLPGPDKPLGNRQKVDVWLTAPVDQAELTMHNANLDLPVLVGWLASTRWEGELCLVSAVRPDQDLAATRAWLEGVRKGCRLGARCSVDAKRGAFLEVLKARPAADLHVFGLPPEIHRSSLVAIAEAAGGATVYLRDSGQESAFV